MGLQTSHNIHSKSGNNSDAWQHKHKQFSRRWTQTKSNDQFILLGQINLESPTEIHFWIAPKIPRTRLAKDLVDKICPILQYLVEHVTCMYLTPSLYVKKQRIHPKWNNPTKLERRFFLLQGTCSRASSSASHPSLAPTATTKRATRSPARSKAIWAKNGYSRGGGWKYGEVAVKKNWGSAKKGLSQTSAESTWDPETKNCVSCFCYMFIVYVIKYTCIFTQQCIYIKTHLYISYMSYSSPFC